MEEGGDDSIEPSNFAEADDDNSPSNATSVPKRHKWSKLWLHASIMCGREFLYAVEIVLFTPIILQLGMPEKFYSFMGCFSPVLGILIGPVMGYRSDRCKSRFGRRRPFITALVIGALIGLSLLIFSKDIALKLGGSDLESRRIWGVVIGVFGAQVMDFCLDQAETPLRAYTLDVCSLQDQQRAVALQTVFIGIGGAMGFIIDGIDWGKTAVADVFGSQIKVVYIFAVFTYIVTTICNLCSIKEIPWRGRTKQTSSKCIVPSQLPPEKANNIQLLSAIENDSAKLSEQNMLMSENNTALPSVTVDICESSSHQNAESKDASSPLSYFPRISMSKGLFISLSCPSGLNKHLENDESLSSLTTSDSALEDDLTTSNDEEDCEDVSISVPNLKGKIPKTIGLLEYVQSKQFIKRTTSLKLTNHQIWTNDVNQKQNSNSLSNNAILSNDDKIVSAEETFLNETKNDRTKPLNCEDGNSINIKAQTHNNKPVVRKLDYSDEQTENLLTKEQEQGHSKGQVKRRKKKHKEVDEESLVSLRQLLLSIATMPKVLRWLCLAQLFGFIAMETIFLWYTDLMGRVVYQGDPQANESSVELALYNDGVKMGCWGLAIDSFAMVIFSVAMERFGILAKVQIRILYSGSFLLMGLTGVVMFIFTSQEIILSLSWCIGITFAVMVTVPYVLVGKYHQNKQYTMQSPGQSKRGYGLDCAILACQMYVGNVVASVITSPIIHFFGTVKSMLLIMSVFHFLASFVAYLFVFYPGESVQCCKRGETD